MKPQQQSSRNVFFGLVGFTLFLGVASGCASKSTPARAPSSDAPPPAAEPEAVVAEPTADVPAEPTPAPHYPQDVRDAFLNECMESGGEAAEAPCNCVLDQMEAQISLAELVNGLTAEQQSIVEKWALDCVAKLKGSK